MFLQYTEDARRTKKMGLKLREEQRKWDLNVSTSSALFIIDLRSTPFEQSHIVILINNITF